MGVSKTSRDWHKDDCFGCGEANRFGMHADFPFDDASGEVIFTYIPQKHHVGAPGYMHGGLIATILDEAQGVLCFHLGHSVMTEQLHIKYRKAVPLLEEIQVRAWITAVRKRRLYTRGTMTLKNGDLLASSSASWYPLPERLLKRIFYQGQEISGEDQEKHSRVIETMELNRKRAKDIRRRLRKNRIGLDSKA